jgi:hypothetical protein
MYRANLVSKLSQTLWSQSPAVLSTAPILLTLLPPIVKTLSFSREGIPMKTLRFAFRASFEAPPSRNLFRTKETESYRMVARRARFCVCLLLGVM